MYHYLTNTLLMEAWAGKLKLQLLQGDEANTVKHSVFEMG